MRLVVLRAWCRIERENACITLQTEMCWGIATQVIVPS
jgi:hypothetical protein